MNRWMLTVACTIAALSPMTLACGPLPTPDDALDAGAPESDAAADDDAAIEVDGGNPYFCVYHGQIYHPGDGFPAGDGCNLCGCTEEYQVVCTLDSCADAGQDAGPGCTYNGQHYDEGESFPAGDDCNGCTCSNGQPMCTGCACFDGGMPGEDSGSAFKCGAW